jgi:membrane-associated phospholipid phosphatase
VFRSLSLKVIVTAALFLASLFFFAIIAHEAVYENEQAFDNRVFAFFASFSSAGLIRVMQFFTFFGSSTFLLPAYVILVSYFVVKKKYRYGLHISIVALSSTALMFALKNIMRRHRPDLPIIKGITNYSFPSGHALSAFIFCGIFIYIIWHGALQPLYKWLAAALLLCFAVTVGVSRIVLRVHYATDVIASFCLGIIWAVMSLWILRKISRKNAVTPSAA